MGLGGGYHCKGIGSTRGYRVLQMSRLGGISVFKGTCVTTLHGVLVVRVLPHKPQSPIQPGQGKNWVFGSMTYAENTSCNSMGRSRAWVREYQSGPGRMCGFAAAWCIVVNYWTICAYQSDFILATDHTLSYFLGLYRGGIGSFAKPRFNRNPGYFIRAGYRRT